mmetsp:Transcript_1407/g.2415  ORF Transcript_1407/g.2415 Transcript_1407/m.2415 type:complete len:203 (-) Transcript_1407:143-751(-)
MEGRAAFAFPIVDHFSSGVGNESPVDFIGTLGIDEKISHICIPQGLPTQSVLGIKSDCCLCLLQRRRVVCCLQGRISLAVDSAQHHGEVPQGGAVLPTELERLLKAILGLQKLLQGPMNLAQGVPRSQHLGLELDGFQQQSLCSSLLVWYEEGGPPFQKECSSTEVLQRSTRSFKDTVDRGNCSICNICHLGLLVGAEVVIL